MEDRGLVRPGSRRGLNRTLADPLKPAPRIFAVAPTSPDDRTNFTNSTPKPGSRSERQQLTAIFIRGVHKDS